MKKIILLFIFIITTALQSAEIISIWHKESGAGDIQDMEILPGGNEFMLSTAGGEIQIRDILTGDTIRTFRDNSSLFMNGYFEITPDSTRFVMGVSGLLQLVRLDNFERLNYFAFGNDTIAKGFRDIVLDPIKPYAYVIITGWEKSSGNNDVRSKISVYNYETMELVKDLTEYAEYKYSSIAVSDDGKYLATLNDGKAYLKVWDLETMELIRNVQLYDDKLPNDWWCEAKDIQFSKLNSDVVYYSGGFPSKSVEVKLKGGIHQFTISTNINTDNIQENPLAGKFILFDNGNRSLVYGNFAMSFFNFKYRFQEFYNKPPQDIYVGGKTIYSEKGNYFIGFSNSNICKFLYDRQTGVNSDIEKELRVSPNPTNSIVNLSLDCVDEKTSYTITNQSGQVIGEDTVPLFSNSLQIDFSPFPSGVYFLTIRCGSELKTYKVVREG